MNLGQIYTKGIIADFMVELLDLPSKATIVDPCFGKGVFLHSLQKAGYKNIIGIEIDSMTFSQIRQRDFHHCKLIHLDFFQFEPTDLVDGFVLNPPYIRQEEIDDMEALGVSKALIQEQCSAFQIYSKANLYLYFIARCVSLLKKGGQMVAILPKAWLNTPDGQNFYSQLLEVGCINNIVQVYGCPFDTNPCVDVMILKFTKGGDGETLEEVLEVDNASLKLKRGRTQIDLNSDGCVPLSSIAKIRRGITTGYNRAFINPDICSESHYVKILSSPKSVEGFTTKEAKLDRLLFIPSNTPLTFDVKSYLREVEARILQDDFPRTMVRLIQGRKPWYNINLPPISDIVFPYIIRTQIRFILNEAKVSVRDNFYTLRSPFDSHLMLGMLNNLYVFSQLELSGKSYGNGLLKIQKYDVDNIVVPHPSNISDKDKRLLIKYAKLMVESNDPEYVVDTTKVLSKYYQKNNIELFYKELRSLRLRNEV